MSNQPTGDSSKLAVPLFPPHLFSGVATTPAEIAAIACVNTGDPSGLVDGRIAMLSVDANGNLRVVTKNASAIPVVTGITDSLGATGTVTGPAAGATIVTLAVPAGTYKVMTIVGYDGTAGPINDMQLFEGATLVSTLLTPTSVAVDPVTAVFERLTAASFTIKANAGSAAGVYNAQLVVVRVA